MKILVLGSVNQDLVIRMDRIPKPGETLFGHSLHYFPGGKGANQAVAATLLGGCVHFAGKVGNDGFGAGLKKYLAIHGLDGGVQTVEHASTGTAILMVDAQGENAISVVPGANNQFVTDDLNVLNGFEMGDLLLVQNEINLPVVHEAIRKARDVGMRVFYNPAPAHPIPQDVVRACDCIVVNEHELEICFGKEGLDFRNGSEVDGILSELSTHYGVTLILTLGYKGCMAAYKGQVIKVEGIEVDVVDTTGAGDCFCGALVSSISKGDDLLKSIEFANQAAALSVTRLGASVSFPSLVDMAGN